MPLRGLSNPNTTFASRLLRPFVFRRESLSLVGLGFRRSLRGICPVPVFRIARGGVCPSGNAPIYRLDCCRTLLAMAKRKRSTAAQPAPAVVDANPDTNEKVVDGLDALRASPDAEGSDEVAVKGRKKVGNRGQKKAVTVDVKEEESDSSLSDLEDVGAQVKEQKAASKTKPVVKNKDLGMGDPEADDIVDGEADPEEIKEALSRPPPVNSAYLPLPWKGRLGYACLCTYLRYANPPVFSSRTCRIASIIENRHPLKDPTQPPHPTKNRPDRDQPADIARGQAYVEALGLANARDVVKMLKWNDKYGIKFLRLSSEMFPFASHAEYGYKLAPFASETLAEAGRVAAELGHRLTTHPGQFTQLGSPRKPVIDNAIRDLEYHAELLSLLKLPEQANRDAVMILHMGGVFGDKAATLDRFRENYARLSQDIKNRLVLENDDVSWSVHELLPICEELNIPLVLDYHHHNIIFDKEQLREGTLDIMNLYDRIRATWTRKNITQKMHYSEPTPAAITGRDRRKHNPRVATLPPCDPTMDLMIEAKDKEQAVFELMRTFKLPGFDRINNITPHVRHDENKPWKPPPKKKAKKRAKKTDDEDIKMEDEVESEPVPPPIVPDEEVGMGGPENRVYWPPGMEEWLRPAKRIIKKKNDSAKKTPVKGPKKPVAAKDEDDTEATAVTEETPGKKRKTTATAARKAKAPKKRTVARIPSKSPTPSSPSSQSDEAELSDLNDTDLSSPPSDVDDNKQALKTNQRAKGEAKTKSKPAPLRRQSTRKRAAAREGGVEYVFGDEEDD